MSTTATAGGNTGGNGWPANDYVGEQDAMLHSGNPTTNYGNGSFEVVTTTSTATLKTVLDFTGLSTIGGGGNTVTSGSILYLRLSAWANTSGNTTSRTIPNVTLYALNKPWTYTAVTWNQTGFGTWSTAGASATPGDHDASALAVVSTVTASTTGETAWATTLGDHLEFSGSGLDSWIQDVINGARSNYGFLLVQDLDSSGNAYVEQAGVGGISDGGRPFVTFTYSNSAPTNYNGSTTEGGTPTDTSTGAVSFSATTAESGSAADAPVASVAFTGLLAEAGTAADAPSTGGAFGAVEQEGLGPNPWSTSTLPGSVASGILAYLGNGSFTSVYGGGGTTSTTYRTSNDGATWGTVLATFTSDWQCIVSDRNGNGVIHGGLASATIAAAYTTNYGANWTGINMPVANQWTASGYAGGRFIALGYLAAANQSCYTSPDNITWTARTSLPSKKWRGVAGDSNGNWVAVTETGTEAAYVSSDNGTTWAAATGGNSPGGTGRLLFGRTNFVAFTASGIPYYSANKGQSWTAATSGNPSGSGTTVLQDYSADEGIFLAINTTTGQLIASQDDGVSWERIGASPVAGSVSLAYGRNGIWVGLKQTTNQAYFGVSDAVVDSEAASGATALASASEAGTALDAPSSALAATPSVSESGAATDLSTGILPGAAAAAETGAASDSVAATPAGASSVAETGAAADSSTTSSFSGVAATTDFYVLQDFPNGSTSTGVYVSESNEAGSASDISSTGTNYPATDSESDPVTDGSSFIFAMPVFAGIAESGAAAETEDSEFGYQAVEFETGAAADLGNMSQMDSAASPPPDVLAAVDHPSLAAGVPVSVAEAGMAIDTVRVPTHTQAGSVHEIGAAADAIVAVSPKFALIIEALAALDHPSFDPNRLASLAEVLALIDSATGNTPNVVHATDALAAADHIAAPTYIMSRLVAEAGAAIDRPKASQTVSASIVEVASFNAIDSSNGRLLLHWFASQGEYTTAFDVLNAVASRLVALAESGAASDTARALDINGFTLGNPEALLAEYRRTVWASQLGPQ